MPLAKPGDPYVTKRGRILIDDKSSNETKELDPLTSAPAMGSASARAHQPSQRRSMSDLPAEPRTQTAIAVVLFYSTLGLSDNEIAYNVGISIKDVQKIKELDAYQETWELLFWELIHANQNSMVARISKFAPKALEAIINIASMDKQDDAFHPMATLKASQDILDRSGLHHETLYGNKGSESLDGLKIVVKNEDDEKTEVSINLRR